MAVSLFSPFCCNAEGGKFEVERFHTDSGVPVDITLIKHGSLEIRYKGISIQIDPVAKLGDRITDYASEFPKADFILVTHEHFDHFDKKAIAALTGKRLRVSLFWLGKKPLQLNRRYKLKLGTQEVEAQVESIEKLIDASSLDQRAADTVKEIRLNDVAEVILKLKEEIAFDRLSGAIKIMGERTSDKAIGYFAYFQLINGFEKTFYMTVDQIRDHGKKYSKAYSNGPWQTDFDSMAKKTVIRQLLKYGPMSTQMQQAERMEVEAAEAASRSDIMSNANAVTVSEPKVVIDSDTGEVINAPVVPPEPPIPPMDY